jgi:large repetitive protein
MIHLASAGPDMTVDEGTLATLNGTASKDPEYDSIASYLWSQVAGPPVVLRDTEGGIPTFLAPNVTSDTPLTFSLKVIDEIY